MGHYLTVLFDNTFSFSTLFFFSAGSFATGLLIRGYIGAKQKKNILKLENEMLKNHSRILELEAKVNQLANENAELAKLNAHSANLKVS
jgi:hypothetical protein